MNNMQKNNLITLVVIAILTMIVWGVLTIPDQQMLSGNTFGRTDMLGQGKANMGSQYDSYMPGARMGDAYRDEGNVQSAPEE